MKRILVMLLTMSGLNCFSQTGMEMIDKIVKVPEVRMPTNFNNGVSVPTSGNYNGNTPNSSTIQQQNAYLMQQAEREYAQYIQRQRYDNQLIAQNLLINGFSSFSSKDSVGTSYFYNAFAEIDSMLNGQKELSIARSVFIVENAFYGNSLDYAEYKRFIKRKADFCNRIIKESKQNPNDNLAKNMAIFRLLTEKVPFRNNTRERTEYHLPLQYDYYDYQSKENFNSHFITKLMASNMGQCYSMPLYYLILAEEMNAEAYWSLSPKHSHVKIQDKKGNWYNIELTCNSILSDAHYTNSSYIKAEALRSKIYLEPLDKQQIIAYQFVNLAQTYYAKYGLDDFYLKCVNAALQYVPNGVGALQMRASYYEKQLIQAAKLLNKPDFQSFGELQPFANNIRDRLEVYYKEIDDLGYEELPNEIYEKWLEYVEKQKLISDKNRTILLNEIR
jgi:hypothetical protein